MNYLLIALMIVSNVEWVLTKVVYRSKSHVSLYSMASKTNQICLLKLYSSLFSRHDEDEFNYGTAGKYGYMASDRKEKKEECAISEEDAIEYPNCHEKMQWMKKGWKTHECYASYGINGTFCSFRIYLSEVEKYCPVLPWRKTVKDDSAILSENEIFPVERNLSALFKLMFDNELNYRFIRTRISSLWPKWLSAYNELIIKWPKIVSSRRKFNIIMHMGFLSKETGFKFGELSSAGGPLGELVQWSDLIAALYLLGHNLMISTEVKTLKRCTLRVLDSFGTHAEFNSPNYFTLHKNSLGGSGKNPWGNHQLDLQQFMTMFPHTDDNTFLGFAVEMHPVNQNIKRDNITLVYGKAGYMWKNAKRLIETVRKFTEPYNKSRSFNRPRTACPTEKSEDILGLGFPFEGPAPLEAIANGVVFINPSFNPPKSRKKSDFFKDKPTLRKVKFGKVVRTFTAEHVLLDLMSRSADIVELQSSSIMATLILWKFQLTSQNPYAEIFIGRPHVLTADIENSSQVEDAIREALLLKPTPYIPFEFTVLGMLQRVGILVSKQDFCGVSHFPPLQAMLTVEAVSMQSCQDACRQHNLLCERSFFRLVNTPKFLNKSGSCMVLKSISNPYAPYECSKQENPDLFSCASVPTISNIRRICPCRDFMRGQTALCSSFQMDHEAIRTSATDLGTTMRDRPEDKEHASQVIKS
ncbi:hypothetical protein DINM_001192 [Dirofilaria immitis]|nr:hypothetical protein [Dirofilaria immitis]